MRILKLILLVLGIILIASGLYNIFVPQEVLSVGPIKVSSREGLDNQTLGMMGLGVLAILAAVFAKRNS
jgi:hypothetical protein